MHVMDQGGALAEVVGEDADTARRLREAEMLVHYVQRNAIKVDPKLIEKVVAARTSFRDGKLIGAAAADFHISYAQLAEALGPVTIGSIEDSVIRHTVQRRWFSLLGTKSIKTQAERAVTTYRNFALIALAALLLLQIYWMIGAKLISDINAIKSEILNRASAPATPEPNDAAQRRQLSYANSVTNANQLETRLELLSHWYVFSVFDRSNRAGTKSNNAPGAPAVTQPNWQTPPDSPAVENARTLVQASQRLDILQIYLLPLLYGLVGAIAYVLRELISETRSRRFRAEAMPAYQLRLFLGMLSGLAVGWFFQPKTINFAGASLTPMALSFLAGYSVEVLFSGMDKIVQSFGSESKNSDS